MLGQYREGQFFAAAINPGDYGKWPVICMLPMQNGVKHEWLDAALQGRGRFAQEVSIADPVDEQSFGQLAGSREG
ncbi:hypothetical protein JQ629_26145 [Bradyrhizobium sp. AUGA SZCCT0222]|uniref:hypothetical protein n=1 Tax=Bradyrhizobium sp. AUGA SZCCT0222 TaxID=2807668 RepID=UPI001BA7240C|nr:hypothetical protein [Bradyrhizobium sp. AUGA SZCCT0222]MBR1270962.1 hypothetical protein [Bradyrhizobium sp. AUGA SZCCT0222]